MNCVYTAYIQRTSAPSGCRGGWMHHVYNYMLENDRGVKTEADLPYTGQYTSGCTTSDMGGSVKIKSFLETARYSCSAMKDMLHQGPISVALCASGLRYYRDEVFSNSYFCRPGCSVNHAVLAVGYTSEGDWILKNSWGRSWGIEGYFYMKGGNECEICKYGGGYVIGK